MVQTGTDRFARALRFLTYAALRDPTAQPFVPPTTPVAVNLETLATYVGTYDFGASVSASDKYTPGPVFAGLRLETAMQDGVLRVRVAYPNRPAFKPVVFDEYRAGVDRQAERPGRPGQRTLKGHQSETQHRAHVSDVPRPHTTEVCRLGRSPGS
jgi:hypothetical protein